MQSRRALQTVTHFTVWRLEPEEKRPTLEFMRQSQVGNMKEIPMKISCKSIFLTLLLLVGTVSAYADPGQGRGREQGGRQQDQSQQRYEGERDSGRGMQRNEQNGPDANRRAPPRNNSRMSPEERSALRRQINEAGQDIYSGKYRR